ncbi:MAG: hypothetical protein R8G66_22220 [Cytophagales bacterium]|nr:hypothetical protein [Cytophagales bacterium]
MDSGQELSDTKESLEEKIDNSLECIDSASGEPLNDLCAKHAIYEKELEKLNARKDRIVSYYLSYFVVNCDKEIADYEDIRISYQQLKSIRAGKKGDWAIAIKLFEKDSKYNVIESIEKYISQRKNDENEANIIKYDNPMVVLGTSPEEVAIKVASLTMKPLEDWSQGKRYLHVIGTLLSKGYSAYSDYQQNKEMNNLVFHLPNPIEDEYLSRICQGTTLQESQLHYDAYLNEKKALNKAEFIRQYGSKDEKQKYIVTCLGKLTDLQVNKKWSQISEFYWSKDTFGKDWLTISGHWNPKLDKHANRIVKAVIGKFKYYDGRDYLGDTSEITQVLTEIKIVTS